MSSRDESTSTQHTAASTIVEQIAWWAETQPQKPAVLFLEDGETESDRITYGELEQRARAFAARLRAVGAAGERVLLLLPSGIDYVVAFLGCLHARAVAVPLFPATSSVHAERVAHVLRDSTANLLVTTQRLLPLMKTRLGEVRAAWMVIDEIDASHEAQAADPSSVGDLAFLQYTSGSTMQPRGVMVTHGNLSRHSLLLQQRWQQGPEDISVTWLPLFHDMGLIGTTLHPLFLGGTIVMMPPTAFVQRPTRWLEAVSKYRGTSTFAPNFAYELCVAQVTEEVVERLDLSSLRCVANAAEKVQAKTLAQFTQRFARCGFTRSAFRPSYGLAESTLVVTTVGEQRFASTRMFCSQAAERGRLAEQTEGRSLALVSNGVPLPSLHVVVANPATGAPCDEGEVGEVWIRGELLTAGYWQQPEKTAATFGARLATGEGPFLRTGDTGAFVDGELYITGRIKDVIILAGQNYDPADIEYTATSAHPALSPGHGAAVAVEVDGRERVVIALELRRTARKHVDRDEVCKAVRQEVEARHGVLPHAVVLMDPATLPMTTSGKIQRGECRRLLCERGLVPGLEGTVSPERQERAVSAGTSPDQGDDLSKWIAHWVAQARQIPVDDVRDDAALASYGVSSLEVAQLTADLGEKLGAPVAPSVLFESGSIRRLAQSLSARGQGAQREAPAAGTNDRDDGQVAVIGMACRFPEAAGLDEFWELLAAGRTVSKHAAEARPGLLGTLDGANDAAARWAALLDDVDRFDAAFFGISPREAECMDPQQRLLMQTAWHALEHAGLASQGLAGSQTGVFVGISANDYKQLLMRHGRGADMYAGTGTALSVAANRLSYWFDLRGPSWAVDTACSSSLVAVHQARVSLASGETDLALAAAVNLILTPDTSQAFARAGMLAEDGRCKTFDASANGYVRGEGCAVVVLKRLADARRDGDKVLAVLAGSAVTHAGRTNGLTAPSQEAHQAAVQRALRAARLEADEVSYVEAHGTGTPLGDPIEVEALAKAYAGQPRRFGPLQVASVKTNVGHLEAAAGLAGLIKVILMLQHKRIPAHLQLQQLNPLVQACAGGIEFATHGREWKVPDSMRRWAGVSSLGFGGSNAHVILGESEPEPEPDPDRQDCPPFEMPRVLAVSARTEDALRRVAQQYSERMLGCEGSTEAAAVCVAALHGRDHHAHRLAVVAGSAAQAADALRARARSGAAGVLSGAAGAGGGKVAFVFTGQGAHYEGMARGLYQCCPEFSSFVRECAGIVSGHAPEIDLLKHFESDTDDERAMGGAAARQPLAFVIQAGLARVWISAGVRPDGLMGHSLGEYAAAYIAGVHDLETVLRLVVHRGRLASVLAVDGVMVAVHGEPHEISAIVAEMATQGPAGCAVAALNGPQDIVVSGPGHALTSWLATRCRPAQMVRLGVDRAFHSPMMRPVADELRGWARQARRAAPGCPIVSTLSGQQADDRFAEADYWARHLVEPVRFQEGLQTLEALGFRRFIEIGSHPVLSTLGRRLLADACWLHSLKRGADDEQQLLENMARWYEHGGTLARCGLRDDEPPQRVRALSSTLPLYPFERELHWVEASRPAAVQHAPEHTAESDAHCVEVSLSGMPAWLRDHRVCGRSTMPGVGYLALAADAAVQCGVLVSAAPHAWRSVAFCRPLDLGGGTSRMRTLLQRDPSLPDAWRAQMQALDEASGTWLLHAEALLVTSGASPERETAPDAVDGQPLQADGVGAFYDTCATWGLQYGPAFRAIRRLCTHGVHARTELAQPTAANDGMAALSCVPLLDGMLQSGLLLLQQNGNPGAGTPLPATVEQVTLGRSLLHAMRATAVPRTDDRGRPVFDVAAYAEDGELAALFKGVSVAWSEAVWPGSGSGVSSGQGVELYVPGWQNEPVDAQLAMPRGLGSSVLIVYPPQAEPLARAIAAAHPGHRQIMVCLGNSTRRRGEARWDLDLDDPQAWSEVLSAVGSIEEVCFLGGLVDGAEPLEPSFVASAQELGVVSLYRLLGSLATAGGRARPVGVTVVTHGAQAVVAGEAVHPAGASMAGFLKSLARELAAWRVCHVDLPPDALRRGASELHAMAQAVLRESRAAVAVRDGQSLVPILRPLRVPAPWRAPWRSGGAYVIVGGAGGLGLALARRLASRMPVRLALVGRSAAGVSLEQAMQGIRALGSEVHYVQGDVACATSLRGAFSAARRLFGSLHGVVHCAFVMKDAVIESMPEQALRDVLAPKVQGTANLLREVTDDALDFLLTFSSINAIYGNSGQGNYAGASSGQDALVHAAARTTRFPVLTVNWGPWSEAGVVAASTHLQALSSRGMGGIGTDEGFDALDAAMSAGATQVIAMKADPALKASMNVEPSGLHTERGTAGKVGRVGQAGPSPAEVVRMDRERACSALKHWLVTRTADVLRLSPAQEATLHATWDEVRLSVLGMDSLTAVELRNRALADWAVDVPLGRLIGGATGAELTQLLHEQLVLRHLVTDLASTTEAGSEMECETWTL